MYFRKAGSVHQGSPSCISGKLAQLAKAALPDTYEKGKTVRVFFLTDFDFLVLVFTFHSEFTRPMNVPLKIDR